MHYAAKNGYVEAIKILIENKADIEAKDVCFCFIPRKFFNDTSSMVIVINK